MGLSDEKYSTYVSIWGNVTGYAMAVVAAIYVLVSFLFFRKSALRVSKELKAYVLLVPLIFGILGALWAFFSVGLLMAPIAAIYYTGPYQMTFVDLWIFVLGFSGCVVFFSYGGSLSFY